jgi:pilus assembly protein Flp/PilA
MIDPVLCRIRLIYGCSSSYRVRRERSGRREFIAGSVYRGNEHPEMVPNFNQPQVTQMLSILEFVRKEDGATSIEYALIASMIAMAIIIGVQTMGTQLSSTFNHIGNAFN